MIANDIPNSDAVVGSNPWYFFSNLIACIPSPGKKKLSDAARKLRLYGNLCWFYKNTGEFICRIFDMMRK